MDEERDPRLNEQNRMRDREAIERELLADGSRWQAPLSRLVLASARRYVPLREVGKAAFLQAIDGARFAVRALGSGLVDSGRLDEVDDAFYLTIDELRDPNPFGIRELVAERRALRDNYLDLELPDLGRGTRVL